MADIQLPSQTPNIQPRNRLFWPLPQLQEPIPEINIWTRKCELPQTSSRLHPNKNQRNQRVTWVANCLGRRCMFQWVPVCLSPHENASTLPEPTFGRFADDFLGSGETTKVPTKRHTAMANTSSECAIQMACRVQLLLIFFGRVNRGRPTTKDILNVNVVYKRRKEGNVVNLKYKNAEKLEVLNVGRLYEHHESHSLS